jgi:uncharacterized protein
MRAASSLRAPWFHVSCCPTNVGRTFASLGGYIATADDDGVQIHQFARGTIRTPDLTLAVSTDYPWSGEVTVRVLEATGEPSRISLRVPAWAGEAVLTERGHRRPVRPGYAITHAPWAPGDEIRLELPLQPRWTSPDPRVDAIRGCVAVERGPLVYCLESTDNPTDLADVRADPSDGLADAGTAADLADAVVVTAAGLTFIPYHTWGNRGLATMRVWVPAA